MITIVHTVVPSDIVYCSTLCNQIGRTKSQSVPMSRPLPTHVPTNLRRRFESKLDVRTAKKQKKGSWWPYFSFRLDEIDSLAALSYVEQQLEDCFYSSWI